MTEPNITTPPSPFVAAWVMRLAAEGLSGLALDAASGRGRHAVLMAAAGFDVVAIDIQLEHLRAAAGLARESGVHISLLCADLTIYPLPESSFNLIVCTRYLDRARFAALRGALAPGGVLLYETFTEHQLQHGRGPRSPEHLLRPGELRTLVAGLDVLFEEEVSEPDALARVAARKPSHRA
jgi:SAM-dependent methyltransferase